MNTHTIHRAFARLSHTSLALLGLAAFGFVPAMAQAPGSVDQSYNASVSGGVGRVWVAAQQPDGKVVIGGDFTTVGGAPHLNIARLNADGTVDQNFTASANGYVLCVAVQADGKLVIGGVFGSVNGTTAPYIARLNADGTRDAAFTTAGASANDQVFTLLVQPDGKLVVAGYFDGINGVTVGGIARLNPDGTRDTNFNVTGEVNSGGIQGVALQADGKIVVGGYFTSLNGTSVNHIARLNADGTLDTAFTAAGAATQNSVFAVAVQPDGKLVLGGFFTSVNGTSGINYIARLNADGSRDTGFNPGGSGTEYLVNSIAVQADGKLLIGGQFSTFNGSSANYFLRLNADGTRDSTFNVGGAGANAMVTGVTLRPDGKILMAGDFSTINGTARQALALLNSNPATQTVSVRPSRVLWTRGGASADLSRVTFDLSTNGGTTWTPLGAATRVAATPNWELTGLSLPDSGQLRARGRPTGGYYNGSSSLVETVTSFSPAAPMVATAAATGVTVASATLNATLIDTTTVANVAFQYSTDAALATGVTTTSPAQSVPAESSGVSVSKGITGLLTRTTYYFRVVATNAGGTSYGAIESFFTNNAPTAPDGATTAKAGHQQTSTITFPRTDVDGDPVAITAVTPDMHLTVQSFTSTAVTFTPAHDFAGSASFSYTVSDGFGGTATGTIAVTVGANALPTAPNSTATATTGDQQALTISFPQTDPDGDAVAITGATPGAHLTVQGFTATSVTFTPATNYVGDASFNYTVSDGHGGSATGTITVTITNNEPIISMEQPAGTVLERRQGVIVWGGINEGPNNPGNLPVPAAAQSDVVGLSVGATSPTLFALKRDSSVVAWGKYYDSPVPVAAQSDVKAIVGGFSANLALKNDGTVVAWGENYYGRLDVPLAAQTGVIAVAINDYHAVALKDNGAVIAWGYSGYTNVPPDAQSGVTAIAANSLGTLALKGGRVIAWGNGVIADVPVDAQSNVVAIATMYESAIALRNDGRVVVWAIINDYGQGNVPAAALSDVKAISGGMANVLALKNDGSVIAWGDTFSGASDVPAVAQSDVTAISGGYYYSAAVKNFLRNVAFGSQLRGTSSVGKVFRVKNAGAGPLNISNISLTGGNAGDFVLNTAGMPSSIPVGGFGEFTVTFAPGTIGARTTTLRVANGDTTEPLLDVTLTGEGLMNVDTPATPFVNVAGNYTFTATSDQAAGYAWSVDFGDGAIVTRPAGTLGPLTLSHTYQFAGTFALIVSATDAQGQTSSKTVQVTVTTAPAPKLLVKNSGDVILNRGRVIEWAGNTAFDGPLVPPAEAQSGIAAIRTGGGNSLAISAEGRLLVWGDNQVGQLNIPAAAQTGVLAADTKGYRVAAVKADGGVVVWGEDGYGYDILTVPAAAQSGVVDVALGYHGVLALKADGSVVYWGDNYYGQSAIAAETGVRAVAAGISHVLVLKRDGRVVSSSFGYPMPATAESGVMAIATGGIHNLVLKNDGRVIAWGDNYYGQCDVPAAAQSGVVAIAAGYYFSMALKADGTIVAWGDVGTGAGSTNVPAEAQGGVKAIAAGNTEGMALVPAAPSQGFGLSLLGAPGVVRTFTLSNRGNAALNVSSVAVTGGDAAKFAVNTTGMLTSIPAGQQTTFTVTMATASAGSLATTLRVVSNDHDEGTTNIALTGKVVKGAPVLTLPASPVIAEALDASGATVTFAATANDPDDGALTPDVAPASGSLFALGDTTVNVSATDSDGLTTTGSFIVRVQDTVAPSIYNIPANLIVTSPSPTVGMAVTFSTAYAYDAVDQNNVTVTANPPSGSTFPIGTTTVTVTAKDSRNNTSTATFTVTVNPPPEITISENSVNLTDGSSTIDFGTATIGSTTVVKTFTIGNTGTGPLSGLSFSGFPSFPQPEGPENFLRSAISPTTVAPGGTATFTVTFAPTASNTRTTTLHVYSNDPDENPFDIVLTGQGNARPTVGVDGETLAAFAATGSLTTARAYHAAVTLTNGKVLVVGDGFNGAVAELYDPAAGTWSAAGTPATYRQSFDAVRLPNGKVLIAGGYGSGTLASAEIFDPANQSWTPTGGLVTARSWFTATLLNTGKVLIVGGYPSGSDSLASAELYDPATETWTATGSLTTSRAEHTATLLADGRVLVAGGWSNSSVREVSSAEIYDPATELWTATSSLVEPRAGHQASVLADGQVLVSGGYNHSPTGSPNAELYNPTTGQWTSAGSLVTPRYAHTATVLPNGKVLITGGYRGGYLATAELYDPASNTWSATANLVGVRRYHTATLLGNGKVLVAGGYNNGSRLKTAELYSPYVAKVANGAEGLVQTGTFSDPNGNATVTLTASSGTITQDNAAGTWRWTGGDGPANSEVTITATDTENAKGTAMFILQLSNAAPTVAITTQDDATFTFTATDAGDQAAGFAWTIDFGDGTPVLTRPAGTVSPLMLTHEFAHGGTLTITATATDKDGATSTAATHTVMFPEIAVELAGVGLTSTVGMVPFGTINPGDPAVTKTFTIKNTGGVDLTGVSVTIDGDGDGIDNDGDTEIDEADERGFTILAQPAATVSAGGSTTFTVQFAPPTAAHYEGTLHIASNDADENPFDIALTANGNSAPMLQLPATVIAGATSTSGAAVSFVVAAIDLEDGTLTPTVTPPSGSVFQLGDTTVNVSVTDSDGLTTTGSFTVTVTDDAAATGKPVVRITAPTSTTVAGVFTLTGTVKEDTALASFTVKLNGVPLTLDTPLNFVPNTVLSWRVTGVVPENGTNTVVVEGVDTNGNIGRASKRLNFINTRPELAGKFEALLVPDGTPGLDTTGLISVQVSATGSFTGKALLAGTSKTISGLIDNNGAARFKPALGTSVELFDGTRDLGALVLSVDATAGVSGTLSSPTAVLANFAGKVAPYSNANQVEPAFVTVAFTHKAQTPALDAMTYPQGDGFATLTLTKTGAVTLTGSLADGTKYAEKGILRADGSVALFSQLYRKDGAFAGELTFANFADTDVSGANLLWLRPSQPTDDTYPAGWPMAIRVDAIGTNYDASASLDFGQGAADLTNGNASLVFTDGALASSVTKPVSIDPTTGAVRLIPATGANYKLKLKVGTGLLSGSFTHTDTKKTDFSGILLNKGANQRGFGFFLSTPSPTATSESGSIFLDPNGP